MSQAQPAAARTKVDFELIKCVTPEFRLSFPQLHEAKSFQGSEAKYSVVALFPKNVDLGKPAGKQKNSMKGIALIAAQSMFGQDRTKWPKNFRLPWRDGDTPPNNGGPIREGYAGHYFVTMSSKTQPDLVGPDLSEILTVQKDLYAGCYCRAEIAAFPYSIAGNNGVGFALLKVQKLKDGEKFSGRKDAADVFDAVETTSESPSSYAPASDGMGF